MSTVASSVVDLRWEELGNSLRAFIGRRVRSHADVDDLAQRVLLQVVQRLDTLRETERLHAWIYRIARNVIADHYRSPIVQREVATGAAGEAAAAAVVDWSAEDERHALGELAACLPPLLRQLTPAYREALVLTELDGLTQAEAASRAGVSLSGMKSRVQRGRRQLKAVLEACCRIDIDRRGSISAYEPRASGSCDTCGPHELRTGKDRPHQNYRL